MSALSEANLIARMCERVPVPDPPAGPGDDASIEGRRATTVDLMVEGVHFVRAHPPAWLGHKLLAVNLSDVGAMGAVPEAFVLTAALPEDTPPAWWDALASGVGGLAREAGVVLVGGDVTRSPGPVMLGVTAWGHVAAAGPLKRTGGQPEELLMLHAKQGVGRSAQGLARWLEQAGDGWGMETPEEAEPCLRAHLRPETSWRQGPWAVAHDATAGMDCSDGLLMDAARLADQSGVHLEIDLGLLPEDPTCGCMSLEARAAGAEDYGLLVLVPPARRGVFEEAGFVLLGRASAGVGVTWHLHGEPISPSVAPFAHFSLR